VALAGGQWAVAPLIIVAVLVLLALFMRWAFGSDSSSRARRHAPAGEGLLTLVATVSSRETALALRAVLSDAGIRSTVRHPSPHRVDVLVFPEDAARARALAASFPGSGGTSTDAQ
jgi:hypothetical protein